MSEMVERATRFLMEEFAASIDEYYSASEKHEIEPNMRDCARRFIALLREPTEAMVEVGSDVIGYNDWDDAVAHGWRAMIDAALASE